MLSGDLSGLVTGVSEDSHDADLQGLPEGASGHLLQGPVLVRLDQLGHLVDALLGVVVDLQGRLLGDVLVTDSGGEPVVHQRAQGDPGDLVDELGRAVGAVVPGDPVEDLTLAVSDTLDVDGSADQLTVADLDVGVVLALLLLALLAVLADVRLERRAEVVGQDDGEQLLPRARGPRCRRA